MIEGTTGSFYGGALPNDNSGTMQFVQIRYSGFAIAPGNELQGLTLGGVGSGTTLDHIQVHNSSDDGIEIFGGRANCASSSSPAPTTTASTPTSAIAAPSSS